MDCRAPLFLAGLLSLGCSPPQRDWTSIREEIRSKFPDVSRLSTESVASMLASSPEERPILLDVRTASERSVSQLLGALPAETTTEALNSLGNAPKDRVIVVYCSVSYRSSQLAGKLTARGYTNVHDMEGSIFQWANEGRPVYRDGERVSVVHPYNEDWGRLLNADLHPLGRGD